MARFQVEHIKTLGKRSEISFGFYFQTVTEKIVTLNLRKTGECCLTVMETEAFVLCSVSLHFGTFFKVFLGQALQPDASRTI